MRYSVASLLTNPVSSSRKPARDRAGFVLSHKPDFHLSLTRFCTLRELCTQIRWRKIRYSVASLLTNPVSSSTQPQGIISNTPQKSVGCLRMCLRLCLRVANYGRSPRSSFLSVAPELSRCSLIFAPRGGRLPPHFYRKASFATPRKILRGVRFLPHAKNQRFFPRGPRMCLRLCPTKCPRFAAVLCGDPVVFPQKKKCKTCACSAFFALFRDYRVAL